MAQDGAMGTIKEVEKVKLYDFLGYVSYKKTQDYYHALSQPKGKG